MKKYLLPTLISLALSHTYVLAEETATPETADSPESQAASAAKSPAESAAPATPPSAESIKNKHQGMMEKHRAHQEYMREQMQKLYQTDDPEERNRLMEEMQQRREAMRKEMRGSDFMPGWGGGPGPRWGGDPRWGGGPWNNGPRWGSPGPNWGGPNWGGRGPQWNGPNYYDMPPRGPSRTPHFFNKGMADGHLTRIEQRLESIEQVLKQIADALTQQNKK